MIPMILHLKGRGGRIPINLYIPLIVVYLLLLPFVVILGVGVILLLLIPATEEKTRSYLPLLKALPALFVASGGTEIAVQSSEKELLIKII